MKQPLSPAALALGLVASLATLTLAASTVLAQRTSATGHAHQAATAGATDSMHALTDAARAQLAEARRATAPLAPPEAARAAGYRPMFGNVPLQGEHYVRVDLVMTDSFDVARPSVLIFAPVKGTPTLVGAAYAFLRPTDAPAPKGFDGAADAWHTHERLTWVAGRRLVMMHAWFVDAPDGAFARYNPWLPYYAAGLTPPTRATLADSAAGDRARRLGFALALATQPPLLFQIVEGQAGAPLRAKTALHRDALRTLTPRLAAAERAGDRAELDRLSGEAVRHADALVQLYRSATPERPVVGRLVDRTVDEFMGRGHGVEEELEGLMGGAG
jgi:hypothetical protein